MGFLDDLTAKSVELAAEAVSKLERWQNLFEVRLAEAEDAGAVPDLKEFVSYLTALKRALEIARIAASLQPGRENASQSSLDIDTLRRLLSEED